MMHYTKEQIAELNTLTLYNLKSSSQGIKIHSSASKSQISAVQRLFDKGLVTQADGGYLTDLGQKAAGHAQSLALLLSNNKQNA